ncbi:MAG TPA: alpha/beta hydrolase [Candidatus Methylomirabilis sp.]|nr:alpha/beta hydrolase [Candidatus Methylomirabilis sp.]
MGRTLSRIIAIVTLPGSILCAQDIAVSWQENSKVGADLPIAYCALPRTGLQGEPKEIVWQRDPQSRFKSTFVIVDKNVKLQVIDWGGSGRPLVLLAGLGATARAFDKFAPKLTENYHVYGITRRGFGASSAPAPTDRNYSADRLGDDVLAVVESLKLNRPVLVGHSIAGEELSSIGSRYPDKVAGLIYLDAGYSYAYYDRSRGDLVLDSLELRKRLEQLIPGAGSQDQKQLVQELLRTSLPQIERDLREQQRALQSMPTLPQPGGLSSTTDQAIFEGEQKYTDIRVPILAIFAVPHHFPIFQNDPSARAAAEALDAAYSGAQARAFENGLPSAHVVRIPNAEHWVFQSNEPDVLREMNAFIQNLP